LDLIYDTLVLLNFLLKQQKISYLICISFCHFLIWIGLVLLFLCYHANLSNFTVLRTEAVSWTKPKGIYTNIGHRDCYLSGANICWCILPLSFFFFLTLQPNKQSQPSFELKSESTIADGISHTMISKLIAFFHNVPVEYCWIFVHIINYFFIEVKKQYFCAYILLFYLYFSHQLSGKNSRLQAKFEIPQ